MTKLILSELTLQLRPNAIKFNLCFLALFQESLLAPDGPLSAARSVETVLGIVKADHPIVWAKQG